LAKAEAKAKAKAKAKAMAKVLMEEMQLGIVGAAISGGEVELELVNETVDKAIKEAVLAERKDLGRL
jgi:hypothetical protein